MSEQGTKAPLRSCWITLVRRGSGTTVRAWTAPSPTSNAPAEIRVKAGAEAKAADTAATLCHELVHFLLGAEAEEVARRVEQAVRETLLQGGAQ